jgi:hypothetical protein
LLKGTSNGKISRSNGIGGSAPIPTMAASQGS